MGNARISNLDGQNGGRYVSDTSAYTGTFGSIFACTASVVALVSSNISGTISSVTIPAGFTLRGTFTSVTPASGTMIIYNKV